MGVYNSQLGQRFHEISMNDIEEEQLPETPRMNNENIDEEETKKSDEMNTSTNRYKNPVPYGTPRSFNSPHSIASR
jgi:protein tyrosine phosphatase